MQPIAASSAGPPPVPRTYLARVVLVLVVAAALVAAGFLVYLLTLPPPIPLTIQDGSVAATYSGNFTSIASYPCLAENINATTTATQSGGIASILSLSVFVCGYFIPVLGTSPPQGTWRMDVNVAATGRFAPNLHPATIALTANGSGPDVAVNTQGSFTAGTNTSTPVYTRLSFVDQGSIGVSAGLVNQAGASPTFDFFFESGWLVDEQADYNGHYGFRATVTGPFTPAVGVGIVLDVVNVPAPSPPRAIGAVLTVSSDGSDWILTLTTVPTGLSNATAELAVMDSGGATAVPATAFGSLYTSAYRGSIVYNPVSTSGDLSPGDNVTLARSAYPTGDRIEIVYSATVLYSTILQ